MLNPLSMRIGRFLLLPCLSVFSFACDGQGVGGETNSDEINTEDNSSLNTMSDNQPTIIPDPNKIDFLFVIDNSSSMAEEQQKLVDSFKQISSLLYTGMNPIDYRIAFTNTSVENMSANCMPDKASNGTLIYAPADSSRPVAINNVSLNGEELDAPQEIFANTADCDPNRNPLITAETINQLPIEELPEAPQDQLGCEDPTSDLCVKIRRKLALDKEFRCHANLGVNGCAIEKGLESMRMALSCGGPNAELFGDCCVNGKYNPQCDIEAIDQSPKFLRPDATLFVVILSDEDDCSTPADNPAMSSRMICQPNWNQDQNNDLIPDIYEEKCELDAEQCYQQECGEFDLQAGAELCHQKRCDVERYQDLGCQHAEEQSLVPVEEYRDFLVGLKSQPDQQLVVSTIVGFRQYLTDELGELVLDSNGEPTELVYRSGTTSVNCDFNSYNNIYTSECCPNGICQVNSVKRSCQYTQPRQFDCNGADQEHIACQSYCDDQVMSCELTISAEVSATPGSRYLRLADLLGSSAVACETGSEPSTNSAGEIESQDSCLSICNDDYAAPLINKLNQQLQ